MAIGWSAGSPSRFCSRPGECTVASTICDCAETPGVHARQTQASKVRVTGMRHMLHIVRRHDIAAAEELCRRGRNSLFEDYELSLNASTMALYAPSCFRRYTTVYFPMCHTPAREN